MVRKRYVTQRHCEARKSKATEKLSKARDKPSKATNSKGAAER